MVDGGRGEVCAWMTRPAGEAYLGDVIRIAAPLQRPTDQGMVDQLFEGIHCIVGITGAYPESPGNSRIVSVLCLDKVVSEISSGQHADAPTHQAWEAATSYPSALHYLHCILNHASVKS